jgi:hypothetical protein
VESPAALQLDNDAQELHVHVPGKYLLNLGPAQLRYSLLPDKGSAKFDKNKQQLAVTLAVAPPPAPQRQVQQQQQQQQATLAADAHLVEAQAEVQQVQQLEVPQQEQKQQQQQQQQHTAQHGPDQAQVEKSIPAADATVVLTRQPAGDQAASKTTAQAQWDEVHQSLDKQQQRQQQQQQQQEHDDGSKAAAKVAQQQAQRPLVKPRLLSRRLSALADLD